MKTLNIYKLVHQAPDLPEEEEEKEDGAVAFLNPLLCYSHLKSLLDVHC
jgi:hypothetical protein